MEKTFLLSRRIGDYVHCNCRVANAIAKRLLGELQDMRLAGPLREILARLTQESQGLSLNERLPSKYIRKAGTLDLTSATLFVQNIEMHARVGQCARQAQKVVPFGKG